MSAEGIKKIPTVNGLDQSACKAASHLPVLENVLDVLEQLLEDNKAVRAHMDQQVKQNKLAYEWLVSYIERTMPIKSHYWILLGSLSILAAFAAVIKYIDYTMK